MKQATSRRFGLRRRPALGSAVFVAVLCVSKGSWAQDTRADTREQTDPDGLASDEILQLAPVTVIAASPDDVFAQPGSVHLVSEEELEKRNYDNPDSLLVQVPGVYVRTEDGFGLRPNIGMRGANSDRSKKVTLMEDGILLAPAPYAAPAAYYFPLITRMVALEVTKGPSAIRYGPNTVGGAIDFRSRAIPEREAGGIDAALGSYLYGKAHLHYGRRFDWGGFLLEGVHLRSDGFKELDTGGRTGFWRTELIGKGQLQGMVADTVYHALQAKVGLSLERSNETYLGLSDQDFRMEPYRRYAASDLDLMRWHRTALQLKYDIAVEDLFEGEVTVYRHDFLRSWRRLNRFRDGPALFDILANPTGRRQIFYDVLTGASGSSTPGEGLLLIDNARSFVSQGVQAAGRLRATTDSVSHNLVLGLRFHHDRVDRDHTETGYLMRDAALVYGNEDPVRVTYDQSGAHALAGYVAYELSVGGLKVSPGVRAELIRTEQFDKSSKERNARWQSVLLPGVGLNYAFEPTFGVLAGVHRGFSPVAPGQPDDARAETSVNYEAGLRFLDDVLGTQAELIGFYNDYSNLTAQCSFAAGCDIGMLDRQFNGGAVEILGLEASAGQRMALMFDYELAIRASYTFTTSAFRSSFLSANPQLGSVETGDELPYVPQHQASLQVGLEHAQWGASVITTYTGRMRERAGQGPVEPGASTDDYFMVDVMGDYAVVRGVAVYVRAENLLFHKPIVSRRPFGARPAKPFSLQVGVKLGVW